jgi:hypothetical protein
MNRILSSILLLVALALLRQPVMAADARLRLPEFPGLENKASQSVNITLDAALIHLAASFLDAGNPEDAAVKDLIAGLKGVYVRSYSFDADFRYPLNEVEALRKQLAAPGWQRLVEVRSRKEQAAVDVYISMDGNVANGLAIIASEPREFTIVNIVGPVDLKKLHRLEGRFGIPKLDLEQQAPPKRGER